VNERIRGQVDVACTQGEINVWLNGRRRGVVVLKVLYQSEAEGLELGNAKLSNLVAYLADYTIFRLL
jgi:hypothetical protein